MSDYEVMYIVHPDADEEAVTGINEQVAGWISGRGGEVTKTNVWGRRKLTYSIAKQTEGTYVVVNMQLDGAELKEVERNMKLHEHILRYLILRQNS